MSPTIEQIDQTFGATHPGVYDDEKRVFTLTFRGLAFEFPAETQFQVSMTHESFTSPSNFMIHEQCVSILFIPLQPSYGDIRQKLGRLQFPPGESPRVSRMSIYCGASLSECSAPPVPPPRFPSLHAEGVEVLRRQRQTLGLRVRLVSVPSLNDGGLSPGGGGAGSAGGAGGDANASPSSPVAQTPSVRDVMFGDTPQEVVSALGAPARVFFKAEDKMKIHSPNAHRKAAAQKSDYFYNYFTLGFVSDTKPV